MRRQSARLPSASETAILSLEVRMQEEERAQRMAEVARKPAVLELPGMDAVQVERDLRYGEGGTFDLYRAITGAPAPTVLFVYGFPDPRFAQGLRQMGTYTSWGRLLACSGLNAVAYAYQEPVGDLATLLQHLRRNAEALGIDASRFGLWAASGNVPTALHLLMTQPAEAFRAAALLYGYMLEVPPGAEQFGLGVPARGRSIDDLPRATPLLVVRAGQDSTPQLNASLDAFVAQALRRDLPLTVVNQPGAPHAFDIFDDREGSRDAIRCVLSFLSTQLRR
jgi:hypothetical protein